MDRPRLHALFDRLAETGIVLVSAGAGYGKTAALSSWVSALDDTSVAWVNCGEEHNDPRHLVRQLSSALSGTISDRPVAMLGDVADAVGASRAPVVVVLDDAHEISNPLVWSSLEDLLRRRPTNLRLVICGRDDEGLPWHRLCAMGEVSEIEGDDLCFTAAETEALLTRTYGLDDPVQMVDRLLAATGGWAAGLCLAGHALRHDLTDVVDPSTLARQRNVRRYFDDELLSELKDDQVRFLEVTSQLERLDPGLCDQLTGRDDSHELLEYFVDHNLFTHQVSIFPPVFRYHQLFHEYLRARGRRVAAASANDELATASRWYEEHGLPDLAIEVAVRLGDVRRAESLIREASGPTLRAGLPHTVVRWLSALPHESLDANPDLALLLARSAGASGNLLAVRAGLASVETQIENGTTSASASLRLAHQSLVFLHAIWSGDFSGAERELSRAEEFAAEHADELGHDIFALDTADLGAYRAMMHLLRGDSGAAIRHVEHILTPGQLVHPHKDAVLAVGVRTLALAWRGDCAATREAIEQSRVAVSGFGGRTGGVVALLLAGAWCGDLELAGLDLERARVLVEQTRLPVQRALFGLAEARYRIRSGRLDEAEQSLDHAHDIIAAMPSSGCLPALERCLRAEASEARTTAVGDVFTERERAVLREIAGGATRREAAERLYLSVNTVKTYLRSAYHKLGATSRADAVERARAHGLLDPSNT